MFTKRSIMRLVSSICSFLRGLAMTPVELNKVRKDIFESEDRNLFLHLGYFVAWYGSTEIWLTYLLSIAVNTNDLDSFNLLTRGMDAKVKCERLRAACRFNGYTIGPNLDDRLAYFHERIIRTRNRILHTFPVVLDDDLNTIHFTTIGKIPGQVRGYVDGGVPTMLLDQLFEQGYWLNHFAEDISSITKKRIDPKTLEIANPLSTLPTEFLERRRQQAERPKLISSFKLRTKFLYQTQKRRPVHDNLGIKSLLSST
jgi:hypothetical protein